MEDKDTVSKREQRLRRQKINRMKNAIVIALGSWMLVSMICCVVLLAQVVRLNHRMDDLTENAVSVQQIKDELAEYQGMAQNSDVQSYSIEAQQGQNSDIADAGVTTNVSTGMSEDNKPREGVAQKVYLTFDDGPSHNTAKILDILAEKDVKATFFVVGNEDDSAKELYQRIVNEGHTLGMHSYSHKYSVIYDSLDAFQDDFNRLRTYLTDITGVEPSIMRFPGGSSNQVSNLDMREFIQYLNEEGVRYYDWNVASGDATSQAYTAEELIENVMKDVVKYDTSVVLMHDASTKATTVEALGPMIDELKELGVDLRPIDDNTRLIQHISADSID